MKCLVFTASYNEAENIAPLTATVRGLGYDFLVVDDRGDDNTAEVVRGLIETDEHIHLIARETRQGYAAASRTGLAWGLQHGYDRIAQLDADGSHTPATLPILFRALDEADLAIGSRYVFGGKMPGLNPWRRLISAMAGAYLRWLLQLAIKDPTSGFRAWRASFLRGVLPQAERSEGFAFLYEIAFFASRAGGRIREIPITFEDRRAGQSKMSWRIVRDAMRVVRRLRAGK